MEATGCERPVWYFDVCGEINTEKVIELSVQRARQLNIKKLLVASETGLSALRVARFLKRNGAAVELVCVTSALGTVVPETGFGALQLGITDQDTYDQLQELGAVIVRGTDPLYNLDAALGHRAGTGGMYRTVLKCFSGGTAVCLGCTAMATDAGVLTTGEPVVAMAGSFVGLDTALVTEGVNAVELLAKGEVHELICKPRKPRHAWPINFKDWQGYLEPYQSWTRP
jgi:hypothetical protein